MEGPRFLLTQPRPPLDGGGLVQDLYLCWIPPPHEMSHDDQLLHGVKPPFTAQRLEGKGHTETRYTSHGNALYITWKRVIYYTKTRYIFLGNAFYIS